MIAIVLYYVVKLIFMPTITTYIPFSAWIPIPQSFETILQIGVPLLILALSLLVANFVRTRYSETTLAFYLAFTITDAILTLFVYGVNFLGLV